MNENLDLVTILKDCPADTKFYSLIHGVVYFSHIVKDFNDNAIDYKIRVYDKSENIIDFYSDGSFYKNKGECTLFPSKEQRDWEIFELQNTRYNVHNFKPFDKILTRNSTDFKWEPNIFARKTFATVKTVGNNESWFFAIPYNKKTKHLIGTDKDCPEYYKWWLDIQTLRY